jgi:predicted metalloprotease
MKWRGRRQSDNVETDEECHQSGKTIVGGGWNCNFTIKRFW